MYKFKIKFHQYLVSVFSILLIACFCFLLKQYIDYRIIALILLLAVSILAILYDFWPVMLAAVLSALSLNILFIKPIFHYKIDNAENMLLFIMYLLIAMISAVFTNRIRKQEQKLREKEEKELNVKLYNTLLNSLSHELRIPITTIIGAIDTLKESHETLTIPQSEELLMEIQIASFRLNDQVENLLNMSRLETGNLQLRKDWVDLVELTYMVLQKFQSVKSHIMIVHSNDNLPFFKIDIGIIEQVMYNLIQNAITYTPSGTTIEIEILIQNSKLKIIISDNGKGIDAEFIERIFDKFYRLPDSKAGGTGLGLSIVKGFVEAHDGNIWLENRPNGGAKFSIEIPCEMSYLKNLKNE